jgi:ribosomal protein S18 acetylase RimI-like enzyme
MAKRKFPTPTGMVRIVVERLHQFQGNDLEELCLATEATLYDNFGFSMGFGMSHKPSREELEKYFRGVLMVPERILIVGRVDRVIAGSIQLLKPPPSQKSIAFAAAIEGHFVVPWARGHGLASLLLDAAEQEAKSQGFSLLKLHLRASLDAAIRLYESREYRRWGTLDQYELDQGGKCVAGHFYCKEL